MKHLFLAFVLMVAPVSQAVEMSMTTDEAIACAFEGGCEVVSAQYIERIRAEAREEGVRACRSRT